MSETEITLHNRSEIRVQAQIYKGRTLLSTCLAGPGEIRTLLAELVRYDIFFRELATGREIARGLDIDARDLTLSRTKGRYVITAG